MGPLVGTLLLIIVCSGLRAVFHGIRAGWIFKPPAYQPPPTSMPKPGESIDDYYRRMEGEADQPYRQTGSERHTDDDAEFFQPKQRKPFCTLRLNGMSESLDALAEKRVRDGRPDLSFHLRFGCGDFHDLRGRGCLLVALPHRDHDPNDTADDLRRSRLDFRNNMESNDIEKIENERNGQREGSATPLSVEPSRAWASAPATRCRGQVAATLRCIGSQLPPV